MKISWVRKAALCGALPYMAIGSACAQNIVPPKVDLSTPAGVNIADGYFQLNVTDIAIGTLSLDRFTLPPAKLAVNDPYFGPGVTHNFDIYVAPTFIKAMGVPYPRAAEYHTVVHIGTRASGIYVQSSPSSTTISTFNIEADSGILAKVSGAYVYTDSSGTIYTFNPSVPAGGAAGANSQRIDNILYADGRRETYSYNGSNQLKMVSDTAGYAIVFDYNGSGDVSAACGFNLSQNYVTASSTCSGAPLTTSYSYTSTLLTSATDVLGNTTTYTRSGTTYGAPISCVTPSGAAGCKVTNTLDGFKRVYQQTLADGSVWNLAFDITCNPDPDNPTSSGFCQVDMTDPASKTTGINFTKSSPTSVTDPLSRTTTYQWMGSVLQWPGYDQSPNGPYLVEADFPEGNKYLGEYNGAFNALSKATSVAKPGSGLSNLVETWGYGPCYSPGTLQNCGKPISHVDAKGNQTDYVYATWGGVLSEMLPAPSSGAARPLKLYTYVQKYAYIKNSGGTLVAAASPIWVPDTLTVCQTNAGSSTAACDTSAPQLVTTYEYGANGTANNLLVHGMVVTDALTSVSRRTCYGYDPRGRKISTTTPRAGLTVCP